MSLSFRSLSALDLVTNTLFNMMLFTIDDVFRFLLSRVLSLHLTGVTWTWNCTKIAVVTWNDNHYDSRKPFLAKKSQRERCMSGKTCSARTDLSFVWFIDQKDLSINRVFSGNKNHKYIKKKVWRGEAVGAAEDGNFRAPSWAKSVSSLEWRSTSPYTNCID